MAKSFTGGVAHKRLIEGVEVPQARMTMGVQWHPELMDEKMLPAVCFPCWWTTAGIADRGLSYDSLKGESERICLRMP